ncbi:MAG: sulfurtransferase [Pseudomonadota bacterium]
MNSLVNIEELGNLLKSQQVMLFDCRFSLQDPAAGRRVYEDSHIPGAHFADMNKDLSRPHVPGKTGRHPLPSREEWSRTVQAWGINPDVQVVLYDDAGGAAAARMWWMLKWLGHANVAVLDGGWQAWLAEGLPVFADTPAAPAATDFSYRDVKPLATLLTADQLDANTQVLLDAREPPRFRGEMEPIDPVAGHIPGAFCSPFSGNLRPDGTFKSPEDLRLKFSTAAQAGKPVVAYCGSGITACHNILAMQIAGLPMPALYAGSWSEWIIDPSRAIATGE